MLLHHHIDFAKCSDWSTGEGRTSSMLSHQDVARTSTSVSHSQGWALEISSLCCLWKASLTSLSLSQTYLFLNTILDPWARLLVMHHPSDKLVSRLWCLLVQDRWYFESLNLHTDSGHDVLQDKRRSSPWASRYMNMKHSRVSWSTCMVS